MNISKVTLTTGITYDKPNINGRIYPKEVVNSAVTNLPTELPITYNGKVVGTAVTDSALVKWDDDQQVCTVTIDGMLYNSSITASVNSVNNRATFMNITGFDISPISNESKGDCVDEQD